MLCYLRTIDNDNCNYYRFSKFCSFTSLESMCWTKHIGFSKKIQPLLGSSSLSPSEWCWHHWLHHQYSPTSGGEAQSVSSSDHRLLCDQESGGPYRCLVSSSLFSTNQTYMFQVAAINRFGVGPFSGSVNATLSSQGKCRITRIQFVLMLLRWVTLTFRIKLYQQWYN